VKHCGNTANLSGQSHRNTAETRLSLSLSVRTESVKHWETRLTCQDRVTETLQKHGCLSLSVRTESVKHCGNTATCQDRVTETLQKHGCLSLSVRTESVKHCGNSVCQIQVVSVSGPYWCCCWCPKIETTSVYRDKLSSTSRRRQNPVFETLCCK
jgi:hypothetical protein